MNIYAIALLCLVSAVCSGWGIWSLTASGMVTPPTPLSEKTIACQEKGRQNAKYPDVYELLRTKNGCDMLKPYVEAYPTAPVPLAPEPSKPPVPPVEAVATQGK